MEWKIEVQFHGDRIAAMPQTQVNGRSTRDGYLRGCGLQFGNLAKLCSGDPLFIHAYKIARARSVVRDEKLINLFVLIRFFLPHLPFGHIVEFGSFRGGSAIFMAIVAEALCPGTKVFAFDSFAGMPATDRARDVHNAGDFSEASFEELQQFVASLGVKNLELVKGMFADTIPTMLPPVGPLRLSHIDCDLFEPVAASYEGSKAQMVPGGYIVFDDPLESSCLGAFEAVENLVIRRDGLHAEQAYPHLVYRTPVAS
jgi:Macrocin-O-methyltransferase (TylF)